MDKIYRIHVFDTGEKTDEMRDLEYRIQMVRRGEGCGLSFRDYCAFLKAWGDYSYYIRDDIVGFYTDQGEAVRAVSENRADINEAGRYPYAAIVPVPVDCMYPNGDIKEDKIELFTYDRMHDQYVPARFDKRHDAFLRDHLSGVITSDSIEE